MEWLIHWLPWGISQLLFPVVLAIAARRNWNRRPRAAHLTLCAAGLQGTSFGLAVLSNVVLTPPTWTTGNSVSEVLGNPAMQAAIVRAWVLSLPGLACLLILTYVILEQPDAPRRQRPIEEPDS